MKMMIMNEIIMIITTTMTMMMMNETIMIITMTTMTMMMMMTMMLMMVKIRSSKKITPFLVLICLKYAN